MEKKEEEEEEKEMESSFGFYIASVAHFSIPKSQFYLN